MARFTHAFRARVTPFAFPVGSFYLSGAAFRLWSENTPCSAVATAQTYVHQIRKKCQRRFDQIGWGELVETVVDVPPCSPPAFRKLEIRAEADALSVGATLAHEGGQR
ncbi:hypothetical protein [Micromonospora sp. CA-111912]|uniref:hypothetical protein n=1 Tax=Micromonospora sp. CA-111912 TaxID=3239955 RepID=UPI003D93ADFE